MSVSTRTAVIVAALVVVACSTGAGAPTPAAPMTPEPAAPMTLPLQAPVAPGTPSERTPETATADHGLPPRPTWLGTRALPLAPDGFGERLPTPPELVDRRLPTPPLPDPAPAPPDGDAFTATVGPVPDAVAARSTWTPGCPVTLSELRYVTAAHVGFDGHTHTGELIAHHDVVDDLLTVLAALHAARFPIEEMRVIAASELDAPPTGDGNVTSVFVCRPVVGGTRWSEHASGRAIDLNPFHNPYVRGDLVLPELAGAYVDRTRPRAGMVVAGDAVTEAFRSVGWVWGGDWTGPATDPMHFSPTGR